MSGNEHWGGALRRCGSGGSFAPPPPNPHEGAAGPRAFSVVRRGGRAPGQMRGVNTAALPGRPVRMNSPRTLEHIGGRAAFAIAEEAKNDRANWAPPGALTEMRVQNVTQDRSS